MSAPARVIGYCRVSTESQGSDGLGMDAQRRAILSACAARGWELVSMKEDVASGKSVNGRQGLAMALDMLARREADGLVVAKLDRLARSTVDFARTVERAEREGWRLLILDPEIDLATPFGRAMAGVISVFAQLERDMISDRIKTALREKRERGEPMGGLPEKYRIPEVVLAEISRLRGEGMSWRKVAAALDESGWNPPLGGDSGKSWHPYTVQKAYLRTLEREVAG